MLAEQSCTRRISNTVEQYQSRNCLVAVLPILKHVIDPLTISPLARVCVCCCSAGSAGRNILGVWEPGGRSERVNGNASPPSLVWIFLTLDWQIRTSYRGQQIAGTHTISPIRPERPMNAMASAKKKRRKQINNKIK